MQKLDPVFALGGRILLALIFVLSGLNKITGYAGTVGYMEAFGVPGILLPLVIALEVGGGLLLIVGWQTRWVALALAGFTLVAAVIFHSQFGDQNQFIHFLKNLSIVGGLLVVARFGAGQLSLDARRAPQAHAPA
jgi:putative oxidoreductase